MMRLGSCVLAGLVLIGGAAWAATGDLLIVTGDGVNVRFEPSTDSRISMRVYRNQQVIEIERQGDWVRAEIAGTDGEEGWIHGSLLAPPGGDELAPPPGAGPEPAEETAIEPEAPEDTAAAPQVIPAPRPAVPSAATTSEPEPEPAQETVTTPEVTAAPQPSAPAEEATTHVEAATDMGVARRDVPANAMPEPAAGPEATDLVGIERFRETVNYLNSRAKEVAGVDLFTGVESVGDGGVQVVATEAWSTVPPAGRRSYLNTLYDRWAAAKGDQSVSVQIVDESGEVVMEKTEP